MLNGVKAKEVGPLCWIEKEKDRYDFNLKSLKF